MLAQCMTGRTENKTKNDLFLTQTHTWTQIQSNETFTRLTGVCDACRDVCLVVEARGAIFRISSSSKYGEKSQALCFLAVIRRRGEMSVGVPERDSPGERAQIRFFNQPTSISRAVVVM